MIAFLIKQGTEILAIKDGKEWTGNNFKSTVTSKDNLFFAEDVRVDPVGNLGCTRAHTSTIGGYYAKKGYYGFERDGWVILVHASKVETG